MLLASKPKEIAPAGTHTAILYQIIDLGTQKMEYQGEIKIQPRIRLAWELCDERMSDGRPFSVGKEYTFSAYPKANLVQHIKSWTGQEVGNNFHIESLLGKACNISVVHNTKPDGGIVAAVSAIAPLKKNEKAPPQVNPSLLFELEPGKFSLEILESLPGFFQEKIKSSPEYIEALNVLNSIDNMPPVPAYLNDPVGF